MKLIKMVSSVGWSTLAIAFVLGLRHFVPELDSLLGYPSRGIEAAAVIVSALCFGCFGTEGLKE